MRTHLFSFCLTPVATFFGSRRYAIFGALSRRLNGKCAVLLVILGVSVSSTAHAVPIVINNGLAPPNASLWRRFSVGLLKLMPIEGQL